jgi:putative DNA primase/helicase
VNCNGSILETALTACDLGLSVVPPEQDGTKRPHADIWDEAEQRYTWKPYQTTPATREHVIGWYQGGNRTGVGLACGGAKKVELFEFDDEVTYREFKRAAAEFELAELVEWIETGYLERTPGGGVHWFFYCDVVRGNTKLACRPKPDEPGKTETLIETRGQGGYAVIAPSNGRVHETGGAYVLLQGGLDTIRTIAPHERDRLDNLARSFDEMPEQRAIEQEQKPDQPAKATASSSADGDLRPGDDYNSRASWDAVLTPHGWVKVFTSGSVTHWRRPGKDHSWSATTGHCKGFKVFSSSTPFSTQGTYSKFGAYTVLNHQGNFNAAAKDLAEEGWGTWVDDQGEVRPNPRPKGTSRPKPPAPSASKRDVNESLDDPHRLAMLFLPKIRYRANATIRWYRGEWFEWLDRAYRRLSEDELRGRLTGIIKAEFDRANQAAVEQWEANGCMGRDGKASPKPEARKVTRELVSNVVQALLSLVSVEGRIEPPDWIDHQQAPGWEDNFCECCDGYVGPANPLELIPLQNGLLHLPKAIKFISDGRESDGPIYLDRFLIPPTPLFFSTYALPFEFDLDAPGPAEWHRFLASVWPKDLESIDTLQEWFGYCLLPDTSLEKILMLIGPKRSGKGTIAKVLRALVGAENTANPTLASLAGPFGLAPLIGKPLAVIADARLSGRLDSGVIVERLLSISGRDPQTIDRKYLESWTGPLPTRFVLLSNELPRLSDASGALASRLVILRLSNSFYGKEDRTLLKKLVPELSSTLLWAMEGWRRLQHRGHFVQPETGAELIEAMEELSSPITAFIRDKCETGPDDSIEAKRLFEAWEDWCKAAGRKEAGTIQNFGRDLRAAHPAVSAYRPESEGPRPRHFKGIKTKP